MSKTFTPISGDMWALMPGSAKAERAQRWKAIVAALQADHYARYHAPLEARIAEWANRKAAA